MTLKKHLSNVERLQYDNIVIGYYNGKAIIKNDSGLLFFMECDENIAPEGTTVQSDSLISIDGLPEAERKEIITIFS